MGNSAGTAVEMEAIFATAAALNALFVEEEQLKSAALAGASGVDVMQRAYGIRLQRLELESTLDAQNAALRVRDADQAFHLQQAMVPPDAPLHERTFAEMSTVEEIAGILTISSGSAAAFVTQARQVCALPPVYESLSTGALSWQQARIFADETDTLDPAAATALAEHFLDPDAPNPARGCPATGLVPARLRSKVRTWRERHHPESIRQRHIKSVADRRVEFTPDRNGMAWISAYLPADAAMAAWNRNTAIARGLQGPNESRTLTQIKADEFARSLLTTHPSNGHENRPNTARVPSPRAEVIVTVPVFALLGLTDEPATLDGYGPIPAPMARRLLADGAESFTRVLLDPRDGTPLEIGRTSYRRTKTIKKALQLRDGKCTFPGCNNNTLDNETDHLTAWHHGGTTGISNLAQLCPKHHRLKHNSRWEPTAASTNEPPGWTSPTGRHYPAEHPDHEPPHWPLAWDMGPAVWDLDEPIVDDPWPTPEWFESWLASAPPCFEPPCVEPPCEEPAEDLTDELDIPPDDPLQEAGQLTAGSNTGR